MDGISVSYTTIDKWGKVKIELFPKPAMFRVVCLENKSIKSALRSWLFLEQGETKCHWPLSGLEFKLKNLVQPPHELNLEERKRWKHMKCKVLLKGELLNVKCINCIIEILSQHMKKRIWLHCEPLRHVVRSWLRTKTMRKIWSWQKP